MNFVTRTQTIAKLCTIHQGGKKGERGVQFILDLYVVVSFCTFEELKNIIISWNENKIEAHIHI
jgi:hypothetical protein